MTSTDRPTGRSARQLYKEFDGLPDEKFKRSLAGLTRRLGERARQAPDDPQAAAQARRVALEAHDVARARRLRTSLAAGGAGILAFCLAGLIVILARQPEWPSSRAATGTQPPSVAAAVETAAAPVTETAPVAVAAAAPDPPAEPERLPEPLQRGEVREVQARLRAFGFDAGPVDGSAGPRTQAAGLRYRQERGLAEAGDVDRALLEELRQDPAPQIAQRPAPPRAMPPPPPRRAPDPFTQALWRMERWFQTGR
jgi:hypothetical protein